ncbi:MAG: hypothetical protein MH252_08305 [Thermosynechococcaceae cyanobacterium MS004]|nr:hypothetical protein [Thermosynechococcaceae cyanobacterium MS004]
MAITWFKLHHDVLNDIKLRRFTAQEKWAWVALLVLASQNKDRGFIAADDEDIADACEFNTTQDWLYYRDKLVAKGMIEFSPSGLRIIHWESRQHEKLSDKPEATRERKRRQRAKHKDISEDASRDVTPQSRPSHALVTRCHAIDTDLDPDQDLDPDPDPENISLSPTPLTSREREMVASLPSELEPVAADKEAAIATEPDAPETKSNLASKPQTTEGQSSAPPSPPKIFGITRWADFVAPGAHPVFWDSVVQKAQRLPERPVDAESAAQSWIQKSGHLLWQKFTEATAPPKPQPQSPAEEAQRQVAACLPVDLSDTISAIQVHLKYLNWSHQDAARYMQQTGRWTCQRGATAWLLAGKETAFSMLHDAELIDLLDAIKPLKPKLCQSQTTPQETRSPLPVT